MKLLNSWLIGVNKNIASVAVLAQVYSERDERHSSPADFGDDAEAEKQVTMPSAVGDGHPAEELNCFCS